MQARFILVSAFEKACKLFIRMGINRIPGASAVYHFLNELLWLWSTKSVYEIEGSKMYLDPHIKGPMRVAFRGYIQYLGKEKLTTQLFKQVIREGDTVVDVGANIGYFTLLAARLAGSKGKVYSFEPEPNNYSMVLKNVALNRCENVVAVQNAVSNENGTVKLYLSKTDIGAHTLREDHDHPQFDGGQGGDYVEVEATTLDEFFKDKKHKVNVIKMDMEGAEMMALQGMSSLIRDNKDLKMFIEFYPAAIREMGSSPEEFIRMLLDDYGFSILAIDELRRPTDQRVKINKVEELMALCEDEEKIVNLYLSR